MDYKDLLDEKIFYFFNEISRIPRESGNEKEISDFLVKFAEDRNLEVRQDEALNVIIKKKANNGYEDRPVVGLQGHMDMVCVKDGDSDHNFETDGIELKVEDGWILANGTTLGADNGLAVAYILSILDSDDIEHGEIEALITSSEETTMGGAIAVDTSDFRSKYFLNIDTEEEGEFTVGCAGGVEIDFSIDKETEKASGEFLEISLKNYYGGHSGMEIGNNRANAIKLLGRLLSNLGEIKIATIEGGVKKNAIPTTASAIVEVKDIEKAKEILEKVSSDIIDENIVNDPNGEITFGEVDYNGEVMTSSLSMDLAELLYIIPNGLYERDLEMGYLSLSSNLGLIRDEDGKITGTTFVRSESASKKESKKDEITRIIKKYGYDVTYKNEFPGWEREDSSLNDIFKEQWKSKTGDEAELSVTHGGLECGILKDKMKDTEFISFGPNIENAHSPRERLNIDSARRVYEFLLDVLKEIR